MDNLIARAELLIQQKRSKEAREILLQVLKDNPKNPHVLAMLSQVEMQEENHERALELLDDAIAMTPDNDLLFYLKAVAWVELDKNKLAEESMREAIRINPSEPEYFGLLSTLKTNGKQYEEGLTLAEQGLALDAKNTFCLNARGRALVKLGRSEESFQAMDGALNEDPHDAFTHANFGWVELEKGDHKKALGHFREALRINPTMQYAQGGMMEALKARYWLYRMFLSYTFWMSNLTARYQWGVIIGFYVGFRVLRSVSDSSPSLAPILQPILILLAVMAFSTWITTPISNLFLSLNAFGKHLLSKKEKLSSNLVGVSVLTALAGLVSYLIHGDNTSLAVLFLGVGLMVPFSVIFASSKNKYFLPAYSIIMALVGLRGVLETLWTGELHTLYSTVFIFCFIGFQWIANFVIIKENN